MDITGTWINQNGSTLTIESEDSGILSGTFASTKGRAAKERSYPLNGVRNRNLVSFAISFEEPDQNLHAITTFAGRLVPGELPQIHTMWILAREYEDADPTKPTQVWNTFLTNSDVFTYEGPL